MGGNATALATRSLTRLAEEHGDVTEAVLERFYRTHPEARASFEHHGLGRTRDLEGRMITESLYLLLQWVEDQPTARIDQGTAIIHHNDTLLIPPHWYLGLVDAALGEMLATLPAEAEDERTLWLGMRADFAAYVESLRADFYRVDDGAPLPAFPAPES
jgi:hypothetical protein